ncbi:MAG TPA: bifunctional diguanylate cyclase/phosphodiesterase [Polyangiaceae bacterium]
MADAFAWTPPAPNALDSNIAKAALDATLAVGGLRTHFQPIVDLRAGMPLGYEVLSRAEPQFAKVQDAFDAAALAGRSWDLEYACRTRAIQRIAELTPRLRSLRYFINVSPEILSDGRFESGFTSSLLSDHGIDQGKVVIEITERESVRDYPQFERLIRHYVRQGFQIALDDFGSGHSSLITLISCSPHFLKLDREIVRGVHDDSYRQRLVRSLVDLAASVDTRLVAEGVELWEELEVLVRLGVRYAQGFLFARPAPEPNGIDPDLVRALARLMHREDSPRNELDETVARLVSRSPTVNSRGMRCSELDNRYRHDPSFDEMVLLKDRVPVGLLTRQQFYDRTGGPVGYSLFSRRSVDEAAKTHFLRVSERTPVTTLARLATERLRQDLYDPVVVTDDAGGYLGTVTMKQLIVRSAELEIQSAAGANPLTGLPGNRAITRWLLELVAHGDFTVVYADLDRFKEFNDAYGFLAGDELIRLAAHTLQSGLRALGSSARLGHIGGDDFVVACEGALGSDALQELCDEFDRHKRGLFHADDLERGEFRAHDRQGREVMVPLTTLSLAALCAAQFGPGLHPALLSQAASSLKKKVKQETHSARRSLVLFDRRKYPSNPPPSSADPLSPR